MKISVKLSKVAAVFCSKLKFPKDTLLWEKQTKSTLKAPKFMLGFCSTQKEREKTHKEKDRDRIFKLCHVTEDRLFSLSLHKHQQWLSSLNMVGKEDVCYI